jgi:hypothetical protein
MVRRLRGTHHLITRRFRARRACPHGLTYNSSSMLAALSRSRRSSLPSDCAGAKVGRGTIANRARSVYAGVVTPARKSAGLKMYICISATFSFEPWAPESRSLSQVGRWNQLTAFTLAQDSLATPHLLRVLVGTNPPGTRSTGLFLQRGPVGDPPASWTPRQPPIFSLPSA